MQGGAKETIQKIQEVKTLSKQVNLGFLLTFGLSQYHSWLKKVGGGIKCPKSLSQNSLDFSFVLFCFQFLFFFHIILSPSWLALFFSSSFPTLRGSINIKFYIESEFSQKCRFAWLSKKKHIHHIFLIWFNDYFIRSGWFGLGPSQPEFFCFKYSLNYHVDIYYWNYRFWLSHQPESILGCLEALFLFKMKGTCESGSNG